LASTFDEADDVVVRVHDGADRLAECGTRLRVGGDGAAERLVVEEAYCSEDPAEAAMVGMDGPGRLPEAAESGGTVMTAGFAGAMVSRKVILDYA
jgi:hypothetical protein